MFSPNQDQNFQSANQLPESPNTTLYSYIPCLYRGHNLNFCETLKGYSVTAIATIFNKQYSAVNTIRKNRRKRSKFSPKKRGGDFRSILSLKQKNKNLWFCGRARNCNLKPNFTLGVRQFCLSVSLRKVDRVLRVFHYTLKRSIRASRNTKRVLNLRVHYALHFRNLEIEYDENNFIFFNAVGFSVLSRHQKGRSPQGISAYVLVSAARSRNISVVAAVNEFGVIYKKKFLRRVNREDFKQCFTER